MITPVRNEADYLGKTIDSMAMQTLLPVRWVIVDDGSRDRTAEIAELASELHPWISLILRPDRGFRKSGGGVIEAFYDGYPLVEEIEWDYIVKLDGDLCFDPEYFEKCFACFDDDPKLGIGGGLIKVLERGELRIDASGDPPFHVRGATKIYRWACWNQIKPLMKTPGWDTIDEVKANMYGWATRTFSHLSLIQLKATGHSDGCWRNWFKNGRANYISGYHPLFMVAKCIRRVPKRPIVVASIALLAGFCSGYIRRIPQTPDRNAISFLRRQQLRRLTFQPSIYS